MPDLWLDVDTALAEVPVNILPLIDDTDFKTRKTSVVYNSGGMDLVWNFVTSAGAMSQTAVTPTTSGDYDWVNQGDGMYSLEMPASGGASINNDTEGVGWFTGLATGVLPWRGPTIGFRAAALNDSLMDAGVTGLLAPTTAARTLDVTATGAAGIDWANVENPTTTLGLSGTTVKTATDVETDTQDIQSRLPTVLVSGRMDSSVGAIAANAITATSIANGAIDAATFATGAIDANAIATDAITAAKIAANAIGSSELASSAINAIADQIWDEILSGHVITGSTGEALAAAAAGASSPNDIADALLDRSNAIETGLTPRQAWRLMAAALAGKLSGAATTTVTIRNAVQDSKNRIVATVDVDGNRSAITTDVS